MSFQKDFIWGAASASYQIEGAASFAGKGRSVWDSFCEQEGRIAGGNTGETACDHYHRYTEDVLLMKDIGLQAYRMSISWPRIIPSGTGAINQAGIDFYDRLIDTLLDKNITPWITLFHWDYPLDLFQKGGWLNPESSDWFAEYTAVVVNAFSDRVVNWFTQNEPQCYIGLGHQSGIHAPGLTLDFKDVLTANHNSLLAHGKSVQTIRALSKLPSQVGAAPVGITKYPATLLPADIDAARDEMFSIKSCGCWNNTWFSDPMIFGKYPDDGLELFKDSLPDIKPNDMKTICQPLDFYGANIYHGVPISASNESQDRSTYTEPLTAMDWTVSPEALYWGPKFLYERYNLPIVVTENGMANLDWIHSDGKVHDPQRIDFLNRYLYKMRQAAEDGVDIQGYFHWSIMDNFEWAEGYKKRFGLIFTDYATQRRILKDSAYWYKNVIETNGESLVPPID